MASERDEREELPETPEERRERLYDRPTYRALIRRIATNTKRLRAARGWTQQFAADACELAKFQLQRVERGDSNVTTTVLARLADGFEVDPLEFLLPPNVTKRER